MILPNQNLELCDCSNENSNSYYKSASNPNSFDTSAPNQNSTGYESKIQTDSDTMSISGQYNSATLNPSLYSTTHDSTLPLNQATMKSSVHSIVGIDAYPNSTNSLLPSATVINKHKMVPELVQNANSVLTPSDSKKSVQSDATSPQSSSSNCSSLKSNK